MTTRPSATPTPRAAGTPTPTPLSFTDPGSARLARIAPAAILVPRVGIDAAIVPIGVTPEGKLDVPPDYSSVGWYYLGPAPGEPGRAVLDGHLDSRDGPAVFYRLDELVPGDEIIVRLSGSAQALTFVVRASSVYWSADAPLDAIYGPSDRPELVLITCDGPFDRNAGGYQQRRIVVAELRDDAGA